MAITAQLARINEDRALRAQSDVGCLDEIISFRLQQNEEAIDLCWSEDVLALCLEAIGRDELLPALRQAFDGECLLNRQHPNGAPEYLLWSEVRVNWPTQTKMLADNLAQLPIAQMAHAKDAVARAHPHKELPDNFSEYILGYSEKLLAFYRQAAAQNQAVITWAD